MQSSRRENCWGFEVNEKNNAEQKRITNGIIRAFGRLFDIVVDCDGTRIVEGRK